MKLHKLIYDWSIVVFYRLSLTRKPVKQQSIQDIIAGIRRGPAQTSNVRLSIIFGFPIKFIGYSTERYTYCFERAGGFKVAAPGSCVRRSETVAVSWLTKDWFSPAVFWSQRYRIYIGIDVLGIQSLFVLYICLYFYVVRLGRLSLGVGDWLFLSLPRPSTQTLCSDWSILILLVCISAIVGRSLYRRLAI